MTKASLSKLLGGHPDRIAGTVYGSVVVLSILSASEAAGERDLLRLAEITASFAVVLWAAHVYSDSIGLSIRNRRPLRRAEFVATARQESSILLAAVLPEAAILLGAVGLLGSDTAFWAAVGLAVGTLTVQALRYARIESLGRAGTLAAIGLNLFFVLIIVALKTGLAH